MVGPRLALPDPAAAPGREGGTNLTPVAGPRRAVPTGALHDGAMTTPRAGRSTLLAIAAALLAMSGCRSGGSSPSASTGGFPVTITRTGGIAGFHDKAVIGNDGSAIVTTRAGTRTCAVTRSFLEQLRQGVSSLAGSTAPTTAAHPDDMVVLISTPQGSIRLDNPAVSGLSDEVGMLLGPHPQGCGPSSRTST